MKNKLKELRKAKNISLAQLQEGIVFKGVVFSEEQILAVETGELEGFDLDLLFKASGFLKVPFHEMLYIPIDGFEKIAKHGDECCLDCAVCFVLEGWFDIAVVPPNLVQIGKWARQVYDHTIKLHLNFTEQREYGHAIVNPNFDPNAVKAVKKRLKEITG